MALLAPRLLAALTVVTAASAAAAGSGRDAQLAALCSACHRLASPTVGSAPIVGLDPGRFEGLMKAFRATDNPNHIMHAVSLTLSDDEIAALASYLATQDRQGGSP